MSKVICEREDLVNIANAIREKTGSSNEMTLGEMDDAVADINGGNSSTGKALITSVSSEEFGKSFSYIDESGNFKTVELNSFLELEIPAPSIILTCTSPLVVNTGDYSGNGYVISKDNSTGFTILQDRGLATVNGKSRLASAFLVEKDAHISIEYIAADNEPV